MVNSLATSRMKGVIVTEEAGGSCEETVNETGLPIGMLKDVGEYSRVRAGATTLALKETTAGAEYKAASDPLTAELSCTL
jgi:hypothetical protein